MKKTNFALGNETQVAITEVHVETSMLMKYRSNLLIFQLRTNKLQYQNVRFLTNRNVKAEVKLESNEMCDIDSSRMSHLSFFSIKLHVCLYEASVYA